MAGAAGGERGTEGTVEVPGAGEASADGSGDARRRRQREGQKMPGEERERDEVVEVLEWGVRVSEGVSR